MSLEQDPSDPRRIARLALYYACIFGVAFTLFRVQSTATSYTSEYLNHIQLARERVAPDLFGFAIPHPGFHWLALATARLLRIRLVDAGVVVLAATTVGIAMVNLRALQSVYRGLCNQRELLWQGVALLLVSALFFPPVSANFYLGQGTPNFWAVPTLVVVRPFAVVCVLLLVGLFDAQAERPRTRTALWLSACLLLSVVMKPSFIIVFGPVAAVYALVKWRLINPRLLLLGVVACLPSLLLLGYQYYKNFHASHDPIQLTWFGLWRTFSRNIPYSILLGTAFPLALSVARLRSVSKNEYLLLSWGVWFVGFLQFAFLAETKYFAAGNFSWGYSLALSLLFVFCTAEWVRWIKQTPSVKGLQKFALAAVSVLFGLHLVSGVVYLYWQLQGRIYY